MLPIDVDAIRAEEYSKVFDGREELIITDLTIKELNAANILIHGGGRGEKELRLLIVHAQRGDLFDDHETSHYYPPSRTDIRDRKGKIVTTWKNDAIEGGKGSIDEPDEGIICENKELHSTRITLPNTSGNIKSTKQKVRKADDSFRGPMKGSDQSPKLFR